MARYWQLLVKAQGDTRGAKKAMRDLKRSSRELKQAIGIDFGRIAKITGAALGVGMAASVKIGVDEMLEAQRVTAQTNAVLKSTQGAANVSAAGIQRLAGQLSNLSGVDDEAIQSGANLLLTFTNVRNAAGKNNDIFDQTTRAALDMSVAMGTDLRGANMQLGKALNDPIKGVLKLQRVGVSFTKDQQKQIKTLVESGKTLEAQKIILAEVNREFGGSAKAAGKTASGAINRLKNAYAEMSAVVVNAVMPSLAGMAEKLLQVVSRMQAWATSKPGQDLLARLRTLLEQAGSALAALGRGVGNIIDWMYKWRNVLVPIASGILAIVAAMKIWKIVTLAAATAQYALAAAMWAVSANPVGAIVLAVIGLGTALVVAYKKSERFRAVVNAVFGAVRRVAVAAWQGLKAAWSGLQPLFARVRGAISVLVRVFSAVRSAARSAWQGIYNIWSPVAKFFGNIKKALNFSNMFDGMKQAFKAVMDYIRQRWNSFKLTFKKTKMPLQLGGATIPGFGMVANLIPAMATGGNVRSPGMALVGEAGPELLQLPRGARVTPLDRTGHTYNVTVNATQPVDTVAFMRSLRVASRMGMV